MNCSDTCFELQPSISVLTAERPLDVV